jgi:SAM-dependent methyltransferase
VEDNFVQPSKSDIDVEEFQGGVRNKPARQGLSFQASSYADGRSKGATTRVVELSASISAAEARSDILSTPPALARYRGLIRKLATFVVKVVTRLSRFVIDRQITFNRAAADSLRQMSYTITGLETRIEALRHERSKSMDPIADLGTQLEVLRHERSKSGVQLAELRTQLEVLRQERSKDVSRIMDLEALVEALRQERRQQRGGDGSSPAAQSADSEKDKMHALDEWYATFQEKFRGTREDIKARLRAHLPYVMAGGVGTDTTPIVDLGCGRGEWLELLREQGLRATGVDLNRASLAKCREMGFDVVEKDILSYLQSLPDTDVGAVTGFHIIEHMPFDVLLSLMAETYRVLKPGGIAIFEAPNPQNVLVGSHTFYLDPTHRNPLPAGLVQFVMEMAGFSKVEVAPLHPYPEEFRVHGSELADRFNDFFYGPQDYAVIGHKP